MRMEVILTEEGSRGCTMPAIPDDESWAVTEFADAELGDARRARRLVTLATVLAQRPAASLPEACGTPAMLKAAYRFFDNEAIDPQEMVASHVGATSARLAAVPVVLAVQDTTELDWTAHPATRGLGPLAHPAHQGLLVHTTLALTPERLPLGLLAQQVWARDPADRGKRVSRKRRPVAEKESQKWLTSVEAVSAARARCPQTHFVCVGDREADVYDLFLQERPAGVDLLVRAAWNRRVAHAERALWAKVAAHPVVATLTVQIPRRGAQPARQATGSVRWCLALLCPPRHRQAEKLPTVAVWVVQAVEERPPAGCAPLAWRLLTTCGVHTAQDAGARVDWYACRWGIEVWHKVLKSGCRIEARQLESAEQLRRCLAIYSVIAWRLLYATMLSRAMPEAPCTALLAPEEWQALYCAIHVTATPPAEPPTLREAVHWIGRLGGFLARWGDGEPGVTVLWKGFQHLTDLTFMYRIMHPPAGNPRHVGKG
jgi:transposase-like protein/transposase Tn5 family protein